MIYTTHQNLNTSSNMGIYEDVLKTEQLMAELKRIDEAENENKKSREVHFGDFPLEQFSDAGKVANEGDPQLKAAADTELYEIEKHAIQIDTEKYEYDNSSGRTDHTNYSQRADDDDENDILQTQVSHMQLPKKMDKNTMLIMMKIHCTKWFTDQHMCHTMKMARNYCCRKQQICHEKTI